MMGHAAALEEVAVRLAAVPDQQAARNVFTQAVRAYADLGATWDLRRADARLRVHGIRRGSRSLYRRPTHGWAALTPTEARVAELVAEGRSNPDIAAELYMSRRTAQASSTSLLMMALTHRRPARVPPGSPPAPPVSLSFRLSGGRGRPSLPGVEKED